MNVHKRLNGLIILSMATWLLPSIVRADDQPESGRTAHGSLRGVTLDPGGRPLASVTVLIHGASLDRTAVSDFDGAFAAADLPPGSYRITASKEGFLSPSGAAVEIGQNQSTAVMIQFAKTDAQLTPGRPASTGASAPAVVRAAFGTIAGIVRNAAKHPVAGATVTATRLDGDGIRATISSSDGIYSFSDVPAGTYSVMTQAEGYADVSTASLQVSAGRPTRTDIMMASATGGALAETTAANAPAPVPESAPRSPVLVAGAVPPSAAAAGGSGNVSGSVWKRLLHGDIHSLDDLAAPKKTDTTETATLRKPPVALGRPEGDAAAQPAAAPAPPPTIPDALSAPAPTTGVDNFTPFAFGDFSWLNGSPRNSPVFDTKFFTPEVRFDTHYMTDFNQPKDHTIVGATESFRSGEVQLEQVSVGGDFHWENVRGRILTMFGMFATTTPRNDASAGVGQWDLRGAYKYVSEAYGGYHFNVNHGLNVDAGIFVSYIGLFSYYNFDNWTYQPSYVSSNTPWFFNGLRIQWFPTNKLKIEPWVINGWQSYAKFNGHLGLGGQLLWQPKEWLKVVANQYGFGQDNLGLTKTERIHTDDSIEVRYYNNPKSTGITKMAFSITGDAGSQYGGGICATCGATGQKDVFLGWMAYNRFWWHKDTLALTMGGGYMNNPGRYLTLLPPINGADAVSGTPYFPESPGLKAHMWDSTVTLQYMPKQYITWWAEVGYRHSDVPYFAGRGGVTPPAGNTGSPQYYTCQSGATAGTADLGAAEAACGGGLKSVWFPDLRRSETKLSVGVMVKF